MGLLRFPSALVVFALLAAAPPSARACDDGPYPEDFAHLSASQLLAKIKAGDYGRWAMLEQLVNVKRKGTGKALIAMADAHDDAAFAAELYAAAARIDGEAVFRALVASFWNVMDNGATDDAERPAAAGLAILHDRTLAWIEERLPNASQPAVLASLAWRVSVEADAPRLVKLVGQTDDTIARHRLAALAIERGARDQMLFDTMLVSLRSRDAAVRDDAASYVAVSLIPPELVPTFRTELEISFAPTVSRARQLVELGSHDSRAVAILFSGLASARGNEQVNAAQTVVSHAAFLDDATVDDFATRVDGLLAKKREQWVHDNLERAREALRREVCSRYGTDCD